MKITGILLAGGLSKRMGREKGNLKFGDRYLYQYPLEILESICDEVLISTCNNSSLPFRHPIVCDEVQGIGPMGGILTCLKHSSNDVNIVLSYDMPLVSEELLRFLLGEMGTFDVILPALRENRIEPLCGIYRKSMIPVFEGLIEKESYAVYEALPLVRSRTILMEEQMPFYRPDIFLNINKESDLETLPRDLRNET